jgi:hypothetical protein
VLASNFSRYQSRQIESGFSGLIATCSRSKLMYRRLPQIINIFYTYWFALISSDVAGACTFGSDDRNENLHTLGKKYVVQFTSMGEPVRTFLKVVRNQTRACLMSSLGKSNTSRGPKVMGLIPRDAWIAGFGAFSDSFPPRFKNELGVGATQSPRREYFFQTVKVLSVKWLTAWRNRLKRLIRASDRTRSRESAASLTNKSISQDRDLPLLTVPFVPLKRIMLFRTSGFRSICSYRIHVFFYEWQAEGWAYVLELLQHVLTQNRSVSNLKAVCLDSCEK